MLYCRLGVIALSNGRICIYYQKIFLDGNKQFAVEFFLIYQVQGVS